jgi:hypothetical protein
LESFLGYEQKFSFVAINSLLLSRNLCMNSSAMFFVSVGY